MKIHLSNFYIILISAILSLFGTLAARDSVSFSVLSIPYLYAVIMILLLIAFFREVNILPVYKPFLLLMLFSAISAVINHDVEMVISCASMVIVFSFLIKASDKLRIYLMIGIALAQVVFLFRYGLTDSWNGNSVCTMFAFITLISLLSYLTKITNIVLMIVIAIAGAIVIIMSSRTSMIGFFCSMLCLLIIRYRKAKNWPFKITILLVFLLLIVIKFRDSIYSILFDKWEKRGYSGADITTGRSNIWINELKSDWTLFGNGRYYFNKVYHHDDAHNIYIQILGRYGFIVLVLFIILVVSLVILTIKIKSDSKMYIVPIVVAYFVVGMFENVLFIDCKMYIPSMIILIVSAKLVSDRHCISQEVLNDF